MRQVNLNILSASDNANNNGSQIDSNQLLYASFHAYFGDATAKGVFKLQGSNDIAPVGQGAQNFTVTNWTDIPNQSTNVLAGAPALLTLTQASYRWIRPVYLANGPGAQTIQPVADVAGSLNSKYFLLNSGNNVHRYYVWINVDGGGVDPAIAGRTGVEIDITSGDTAATIGAALATAIAALSATNDFTATGTTTVTVTNKVNGPFARMVDGAAPTGFTFAVAIGGTSTVNVNMFALGG